MQSGQTCCFHHVKAVFLFSYSSVWSALPPARWGNSVLNAALCPKRSAPQFTTCPALGGWSGELLCLSRPLLSASASSGRLVCHPTPALILCCLTSICSLRVQHWEFSSLSHHCSPVQVQCSTPTSAVGVKITVCCLCCSVLLRGVSLGSIVCGAWC
jgi:hypothetical protein